MIKHIPFKIKKSTLGDVNNNAECYIAMRNILTIEFSDPDIRTRVILDLTQNVTYLYSSRGSFINSDGKISFSIFFLLT